MNLSAQDDLFTSRCDTNCHTVHLIGCKVHCRLTSSAANSEPAEYLIKSSIRHGSDDVFYSLGQNHDDPEREGFRLHCGSSAPRLSGCVQGPMHVGTSSSSCANARASLAVQRCNRTRRRFSCCVDESSPADSYVECRLSVGGTATGRTTSSSRKALQEAQNRAESFRGTPAEKLCQ